MRATTMVAGSRTRRSWLRLVLLGVFGGVVGGLAVGAVAGERRTYSAADRLIEATAAPDAYVFVRAPDPELLDRLSDSLGSDPEVRAVWPIGQFIGRTSDAKDWYYPMAGPTPPDDVLQPLLVRGREPAEDAAEEVVISAQTAESTGLDVGDVVPMDLYTPEQMVEIIEDTETEPGGSHLELRVVGVVRDSFDIAPGAADRLMIGSTAMYERYSSGPDNEFAGFAVRAVRGAEGMDAIVASLSEVTPPEAFDVRPTAELVERIQPANRVLRIGIWLLATVVAGIGSFVLAQVIRRHVDGDRAHHDVLRAVGFTRGDAVIASTLPGTVSAACAVVVTAGVAFAVSPLFPLGHARLLEPAPGVDAALVVLVPGALLAGLWVLVLFALIAWFDLERAPRPHRREPARWLAWASSVAPPPVLLGLHLATDPSRIRQGVRARTAALGAALGIAGLIATTTFLVSLDHLVDTPVEYGIDHDLSIEVPDSQVDTRLGELAADDRLDAVAVQRSSRIQIDGRTALGLSAESSKGSIMPVLVEGRLPAGPDEVLVGPELARELDVSTGDTVRLGPDDAPRDAKVVGLHLDPLAISAESSASVFLPHDTLAELAPEDDPPYPTLVVRYADGVDAAELTRDLDRRYPYGVMDESFPHPPSTLSNLDAVRTVPIALAWFFAALTVVALGNGVVATGRRARRTIGVVRSLGFTSSQVRAAMVSMGLLLASGALLIGLPLGAILGAATWSRVSAGLDIAPNVRWAFAVLGVVVLAVPVLGVGASLWPARVASSRAAAEVLRAE
ncbi:MAG: ABC transporter permease [Microthrixaceae bacterium]